MHDVQALTRFGAPLTIARTRWMFGFHRRLVRRCEWLTAMPNDGFLPHTPQTDAMTGYLEPNGEMGTTGARPQPGENRRVSIAVGPCVPQSPGAPAPKGWSPHRARHLTTITAPAMTVLDHLTAP